MSTIFDHLEVEIKSLKCKTSGKLFRCPELTRYKKHKMIKKTIFFTSRNEK